MTVLVLALVLRIAWAGVVPVAPVSDAVAYDTFARHLAAGNAYGWDGQSRSAYWPVGTAFAYALAFRAADPDLHGYLGPVVLNTAAGLAVVGLGMALALRWFGRGPGLVAGVLLALWPMHVQFSTVLASELLFTALCLGALAAWPGAAPAQQERSEGRIWGWLVLSGVLFACAAYVRPTAILLPAVLAGCEALRAGSARAIARAAIPAGFKAAVVGAVMAACIAPWSMRNYDAFGRFVLISNNGGANLWMGNSPGSSGGYRPVPDRTAGINEAEFDARLGREAMAHIREAPVAFLGRTLVKAARLHERETIGIVWNAGGLSQVASDRTIAVLKWGSQICWVAVLGLGVIGIGVVWSERGGPAALLHPAVAVWMYFTAVHAVIVYQDRYHFPATPLIAALAGAAVVWAVRVAGRHAGMWEEQR